MNVGIVPYIETVNKLQQTIVILRDVSASMEKTIDYENDVMRFFFREGRENRFINRHLICLIDFSEEPKVVLDWTLLKFANPELTFEADGITDVNKAVMFAIEKCESKIEEFSNARIPYGPPLIILLTDGEPTSSIEESVRIVQEKRLEKDGNGNPKFIFLPIYVGDGEAPGALRRYANYVPVARSPETYELLRNIFYPSYISQTTG